MLPRPATEYFCRLGQPGWASGLVALERGVGGEVNCLFSRFPLFNLTFEIANSVEFFLELDFRDSLAWGKEYYILCLSDVRVGISLSPISWQKSENIYHE